MDFITRTIKKTAIFLLNFLLLAVVLTVLAYGTNFLVGLLNPAWRWF